MIHFSPEQVSQSIIYLIFFFLKVLPLRSSQISIFAYISLIHVFIYIHTCEKRTYVACFFFSSSIRFKWVVSSWFNESGRRTAFPSRSGGVASWLRERERERREMTGMRDEREGGRGKRKRKKVSKKKQPHISRRTGVHKTFGKADLAEEGNKQKHHQSRMPRKQQLRWARQGARAKLNERPVKLYSSVDSCYQKRPDIVLFLEN